MIARITVVDGTLTEYPLAEKVPGGWQNGATFYPDEKVTEVKEFTVHPAAMTDQEARDEREALIAEASDLIAYHLREQEFDPRYRSRTPAEQAELIGRLVAALREHPEPEWEYGAQHAQGVAVAWSREEAERAVAGFLAREPRLQLHARGRVRLLRRVKAGPWEQVNP